MPANDISVPPVSRPAPVMLDADTPLRLSDVHAVSDCGARLALGPALRALAGGGSADGEGLHGWASLQWTGGRPAVTVYLSPRLYLARFGPVALAPERMWPSPVPGRLACASA